MYPLCSSELTGVYALATNSSLIVAERDKCWPMGKPDYLKTTGNREKRAREFVKKMSEDNQAGKKMFEDAFFFFVVKNRN